jgi:pimeloyl-ACP methyl ester carboxylesterase
MKDSACREKALRQWRHAFPVARTVQLTTVSHFVQEEAPGEVAAAVVPFLRGG